MTLAEKITNHFIDSPRVEFSSNALHAMFGSSFRSRVSDINATPESSITIKNRTTKDSSVYWSEPNDRQSEL